MRAVLIGGGDLGAVAERPYNLKEIDEEIFAMTGKAHPRILFIGFNERANFISSLIKKNFMIFGAQCEYLKFTELTNTKTVESKIKRADAIYLGGGNTIEYMRMIAETGLDKFLIDAMERNVILCGISAGAMIYCKAGLSDAGMVDARDYVLAEGLGFVNVMFCPHYSSSARREKLPEKLLKTNLSALAVDDSAAVVLDGEKFKVIKSRNDAKAYVCKICGGEFAEKELEASGNISEIF